MKNLKCVIGYILSIFFTLFSILGLLGVIVSHNSVMDIAIGIVWILIGTTGLYLSLKLAKKKAVINKENAKRDPENIKESKNIPVTHEYHEDIIKSMQEDEKQDKFEISIPKRKNNVPLAYQYQHQDILSLNIESAIKATENNALELSAQIDGNDVLLYSSREKIGILGGNRIDMLKDWIRNNEPYLIYLEGIDTENKKAIVHLAFYRDKREKMSWREHVTIKLTNYKKEDAQMVIPVLENGNELDLNENYSDRSASEYVGVEESYVEIGRLPKKMCERYLEEGAAGCFFDHADYDEEKDVYIPYVTIYW